MLNKNNEREMMINFIYSASTELGNLVVNVEKWPEEDILHEYNMLNEKLAEVESN